MTYLISNNGDIMKTITVWFKDRDFEKLQKKRNGMTWRDYILKTVTGEENND